MQGDVDLGTATVIAVEYDKLAADLRDEAKPVVLEQFLDVSADRPTGVRRLRRRFWRATARMAQFEEHQENAEGLLICRPETKPRRRYWEYQLITDTRSSRRRSGHSRRPAPTPTPVEQTFVRGGVRS